MTLHKPQPRPHVQEILMRYLPEGATIYSLMRWTDNRGKRTYSFFVVNEGEIICLDPYIAFLLGYKLHQTVTSGVGVYTSGNDAHSLVAQISHTLYGRDNAFHVRYH